MHEEAEQDAQFGLAVRSRRAQLGITLDQLAQASGVSTGTLSRLERGVFSPTLRNAMAIARGLGCDLADLVESPVTPVTRAGEHLRLFDEETRIERLTLSHPTSGVELLHYTVPAAAASSHFSAHKPGSKEVFHVLAGQLEVTAGTETISLGEGDTATLRMDCEHHFRNRGKKPARFVLLVLSR
jgi:transcriptional regulator with XRE-family HTH domain